MAVEKSEYDSVVPQRVSHLNVGTGTDLSIADLAHLVADTIGYGGRLTFDVTKPDGTPRKLLDVSRLARLGWHAQIDLREGLASTYEWFVSNASPVREV